MLLGEVGPLIKDVDTYSPIKVSSWVSLVTVSAMRKALQVQAA